MIHVHAEEVEISHEAAVHAHSKMQGCPFLSVLHVVGLSFKTADLQFRGQVSFAPSQQRHILAKLSELGISEAMLLCTCNRTEVLFFGENDDAVVEAIAVAAELSVPRLEEHLYHLQGESAAEHLFKVCSGLDSAIIGETDILAQVKEAWGLAQEIGTAGPWLNLLLRRGMSTSKKVRTQTDLSRGVTSLGTLAVREASHLLGGLTDKCVVVLGAGKIAERVVKDLRIENSTRITVVNRTLANAVELAARHEAEALSLADLDQALVHCDVIFSAVDVPAPILNEERLEATMNARQNRPLLVVDLGVPANVSPDAKKLSQVRAIDLDELIDRIHENTERRIKSLPGATAIVEQEVAGLREAFMERQASATIESIMRYAEDVKAQNLTWALDRLGDLDDKQKKVVEDLALRMVRGFVESPIKALKTGKIRPSDRQAVEKLFRNEGGHSHA